MRLVIVTGLSGAGKSHASGVLEDLGFYCVDNLPPALIPTFAELCAQSGRIERVALVVDIRGREFFDSAVQALEELEARGFSYQILFLEASNEVLIRRYKETRRRHPLAPAGRIPDGVEEERRRLEPLRGRANRILDTTGLSPGQLREQLSEAFGAGSDPGGFTVQIVSFGYKHGLPLDADLALDVRFLPNPHYVASLRPLTGRDQRVVDYVLRWPVTQRYLQLLGQFVDFLLPQYVSEGKPSLTVAIGCTGGRHRSVVVGDWLADRVRQEGYRASVRHRDCDRPTDAAGGEAQGGGGVAGGGAAGGAVGGEPQGGGHVAGGGGDATGGGPAAGGAGTVDGGPAVERGGGTSERGGGTSERGGGAAAGGAAGGEGAAGGGADGGGGGTVDGGPAVGGGPPERGGGEGVGPAGGEAGTADGGPAVRAGGAAAGETSGGRGSGA